MNQVEYSKVIKDYIQNYNKGLCLQEMNECAHVLHGVVLIKIVQQKNDQGTVHYNGQL